MTISLDNPAGFTVAAVEDVAHLCRNVNNGLTIRDRICANYEAVVSNSRLSKNGQARGQAFEIIAADAIHEAVGGTYEWRGHLKCAQYNAEIDIVLYDPRQEVVHGIFLKTSFRERWKQEDRDAMLFDKQWDKDLTLLSEALGRSVNSFTPWALCFKEKPQQSPQEAAAHFQRISNVFAGIKRENVMSVYDVVRMSRFEKVITP
jgi:hypothetical protein